MNKSKTLILVWVLPLALLIGVVYAVYYTFR